VHGNVLLDPKLEIVGLGIVESPTKGVERGFVQIPAKMLNATMEAFDSTNFLLFRIWGANRPCMRICAALFVEFKIFVQIESAVEHGLAVERLLCVEGALLWFVDFWRIIRVNRTV